MRQGYFNFHFQGASDEHEFLVSTSNIGAFSYIQRWPNWDSNIALLYGPHSCGKTLLAHVWSEKSAASFLSRDKIYTNSYSPSKNYVVEDIEKIADEAALLHFFNTIKEANTGFLLLTARGNPHSIGIRLLDLRSRLNAIPSLGIADPDDELLKHILAKEFSRRQLKVEREVIQFMLARIQRSFDYVYHLVEVLDTRSMEEKKNITIPFVKAILDEEAAV